MAVPEDRRVLNCQFNFESIGAHVNGYADALSSALLSIVKEIDSGRMRRAGLWVAGNSGSAAIATHLVCDWVKGTFTASQTPLRVHSLVSNTALLTACANDFGYDAGFARQIEMQVQPGDVLTCISSSENSASILAALRKASSMLKTIALAGFGGGESVRLADISLHVGAHNYGVSSKTAIKS